jgi:MFS family permease
MLTSGTVHAGVESPFAWLRLATAVLLGTIGSVGMWAIPVVLPTVQVDFGVARAGASIPYTLAMVGFACGGVAMGRVSDRFGMLAPVACGSVALGTGFIAAAFAFDLTLLAVIYALIGLGASATFGPLMADISQWFDRRRGIAVTIAASGNYVGGAIWPPVLQHFVSGVGWRPTHIGVGIFCVLATLPLLPLLRRRAPLAGDDASDQITSSQELGLSPNALQALLCAAGAACCVAMAMPQVHIVAYCGDLGYGVARGTEMLSLMLLFGIISRIGSGFVADRIGAVATLLVGSVLQAVALFLYMLFDGLASLYVISALFGLFQGGIVPMYAIIVRQYFPAQEVGMRLGIVLMATLFGMALGGWMSGVIFDHTGSYHVAFVNGLLWNLLNVSIALWLLIHPGRRRVATV